MPLIGVTGRAGSGKDTVCQILIDEFGYQKIAFADPMRDILETLNPIVSDYGLRWNHAVEEFGYAEAKLMFGQEGRRLLQVLGTEVGRDMFGEDFWVEQSVKRVKQPNTCWSDVRFLNEVKAIHDMGGWVVRVNRPGTELDGSAGQHASELEMDEILAEELDNDGTIETLQRNVREMMHFILSEDMRDRGDLDEEIAASRSRHPSTRGLIDA